MYNSTNNNIITSDKILNTSTTEIDIFEYYLKIPVEFGKLLKSPSMIRSGDRFAGCKFWYNGSKIKFIDFALGLNEDCFGIVKYIYNINYNEALLRVCEDFRLFGYSTYRPKPKLCYKTQEFYKENQSKNTIIRYGIQLWNQLDANYWKKIQLTSKILEEYSVVSCKFVFINNRLYYSYKENDPCYCYEFPDGTVKLYFPFRKKSRFITNSTYIQGFNLLPTSGDKLIITKSLKDVMVLYKVLGIPSISLQSEQHKISKADFNNLLNRFDNIYILYDNDKSGRLNSAKRCKEFEELIPIFYPEDIGKDTSEVIEECGVVETIEILNSLL